jgi:hypothetical protein
MNNTELAILTIASIFIIESIIAGVIGIIKKEIAIKRIFLRMLMKPAHWVAGVMFYIFDKFFPAVEKEKGFRAVTASIGLFLFAFLLIIVFWYTALAEFKIISEELYNIMVIISLWVLILGTPITLAIVNKLYHKI